jgi:hypothetical protein
MMKKALCFLSVLATMTSLSGQDRLHFYTDVFAWYPDGEVRRISPGDGIYFQPCIHPDGTHVVYYGNSSGPPRVWKANLTSSEIIALTPADADARHPVYNWQGDTIAFSSDHGFDQKQERMEDMTPSGELPADRRTVSGRTPLLQSGWKIHNFCLQSTGQEIQLVDGPSKWRCRTYSIAAKRMGISTLVFHRWSMDILLHRCQWQASYL